MQFLYPIGLLALAGLIIPVLIHLWSVKEGKTLKIGSIALLGENATTSSRSFKLTDILLFVLRCLILILVACILAQPYFKSKVKSSQKSGWILMDKNQFTEIYQTNGKTIDSLLNIGFELHDFNVGFNSFLLRDTTISNTATKVKLSYNSLLHQLNKQLPAGYSAYLFADHRLNHFDGALSTLNFRLTWKEIKLRDTLKNWSSKFLGKVYKGQSTPTSTNYSANQSQVLPTIAVVVYDKKSTDDKYVKAALRAISDFTKRKIEVGNWNLSASAAADIGFWLSDETIPSSYLTRLKKGGMVFTYEKGKTVSVNSSLRLSAEANENIELKKRIDLNSPKGNVVWLDGFGNPILLKQNQTGLNYFHFYSRFDPQWTDLVWKEQFVKALMPIVLNDRSSADFGFENHPQDQRLLDKTQLSESKLTVSKSVSVTISQNIANLMWSLAGILLVIERILSFQKKTKRSYAKS